MYLRDSAYKQNISLKITNGYVFIIKPYNVFPEVVTKFMVINFTNLRFITEITICVIWEAMMQDGWCLLVRT